jgi:hypothetical protein
MTKQPKTDHDVAMPDDGDNNNNNKQKIYLLIVLGISVDKDVV